MPNLYEHNVVKFADAGLQLRLPVDAVPPNQYSQLTNALPVIEGRIETRAGLNFIVQVANTTSPGSGLHSLTRINQPSSAGTSDRLAGIDTTVQSFALPNGTTATSQDTGRTGDPLSLPTFHYLSDTPAWQIIADRSGMKKFKHGPGGTYYVNLGIQPPTIAIGSNGYFGAAAQGTDAGAGNLNNGSGPGYDWRYTYVNTVTQSEGNPSSILWSGATVPNEVRGPTTITTPDPGFGGSAATSTTGGGGIFPVTFQLDAGSAAETRQSILLSGWQAATQQYSLLNLEIQLRVTIAGGTTGGCAYYAIYLSLDSGQSWNLIIDGSVSQGFADATSTNPHFVIPLNINQDTSKIQVRAVALGVGSTTVPQNVTSRRIRQRGGNYDLSGLLTGGGGNATVTFNVDAIETTAISLGQTVNTLALANRKASVAVRNPIDPQINAVRLYRRGGSITAGWAFVMQSAPTAHDGSGLTITDNVADSSLGGFLSLTNDAPVNSVYIQGRWLPYVWGPGFNPSRLFGCGDPDRPGAVYFSNPGNADQWGVGQWIDVSSPSDPMQNGCVYNTRVFAFSIERMFEIAPSLVGGSTFTPYQTPCSRGLISPWGLLATAKTIYFVAKDGIYATNGGEEQSLVENNLKPLFPTLDNPTGRQVEGYDYVDFERIEDIRLAFHNDELYFIYRGATGGQLQMFVYDQLKNRWRGTSYPTGVYITSAYSEQGIVSSLLLGDASGNMYSTATGQGDVINGSTQPITVSIRTGAFDQGQPLNQKEYGNVVFDIDPGGATVANPVTITPLLNGETITDAALTITGSGRQQVPLSLGDVFGFNIEYQISYSRTSAINPILYQFDTLWRLEPAQVKHWEARESSFGFPGWLHLRDCYVTLRSSATVTLTLTFDNGNGFTTQTYSIASTAGNRRKIYIPFSSNKGKLYKFSLDSSSSFRLYEEDIEVRAKPWLTALGYQVLRPFGGEGAQAIESFEAQTLGGGR